MPPRRKASALGIYLLICAFYQLGLYICIRAQIANESAEIYDPRAGLLFLATAARPERRLVLVSVMQWGSAAWLMCLGLATLALRRTAAWLVLYIVSECALALPTILYVAVSAFGGAGELSLVDAAWLGQIVLLVVFTIAPVTFTLYILGGWRTLSPRV